MDCKPATLAQRQDSEAARVEDGRREQVCTAKDRSWEEVSLFDSILRRSGNIRRQVGNKCRGSVFLYRGLFQAY